MSCCFLEIADHCFFRFPRQKDLWQKLNETEAKFLKTGEIQVIGRLTKVIKVEFRLAGG